MITNRFLQHIIFTICIAGITTVIPVITQARAKVEISPVVQSESIKLSIKETANELPGRIIIPSSDINLNIKTSKIINGTWEIPDESAGYAQGSSFLDQHHGNSVIFAHAQNGMFRNLLKIRHNDEITIIGTENIYTYKVNSIERILPDEVDKLKSYGDHHLTLFTCEGINDEYRLLVKAVRVDTQSLNNSQVI